MEAGRVDAPSRSCLATGSRAGRSDVLAIRRATLPRGPYRFTRQPPIHASLWNCVAFGRGDPHAYLSRRRRACPGLAQSCH
jgi:hypothetical protein